MNKLIIKFYDVGHGNCTHIITPNGKHILVDVGSKEDNSIIKYIKSKYFCNGGRIDGLIITHTHEDHIYDLPQMETLVKPKVINKPSESFDIPLPDSNIKNFELHKKIVLTANKINREYNYPVSESENPFKASNNGNVSIETIRPPRSFCDKNDPNTFSPFISICYWDFKCVLTGDNPKSIVEKMIELNEDNLKSKIANANVFLAPHHGRSGEYSDNLFKIVNPVISIISDKSIEHDTQEGSSKLYEGEGVSTKGQFRKTLTTRNDGSITIEVFSDGKVNYFLNSDPNY